jgi:pimeloyl-ACP methyl ester carboxylesterase
VQDNRVEADHTSRASQVTPHGLALTTEDGIPLSGIHFPDPHGGRGTALAVCHGFTHHTRHPATRAVLAELSRHAGVVALDMRGHGRSGGRNTVGDRELLDLDAAVAWARSAGYERVTTVGFSLGAAVALRHAALGAARPDAVVAVSGPARWYSRETAAMRRVHWLLEQPHGRAVARLLGVRLDVAWTVVPPSPLEVVAAVAPAPLLLVHFAGDRYFSAAHPAALAAAADRHAELWIEPGAGHGESGTDAGLAARIAGWAVRASTGPGADPADNGSTVGVRPEPGRVPAERRAAGSEVG